jgi:peroxiredoxin family protein
MAEKMTIIVHSGDMDKIYSALILGNGALSMGMEASLFFTFWGLKRLEKGGLEKGPLSKMNLFGLGRWMIRKKMAKAKVASLDTLLMSFKELGGKIIACDMTMDVMGIKNEDFRNDVVNDCGGVGAYIKEARESSITLFI